ncbi:PfkB family carbohydrate kinase [Streptomyces sp. ATexAB-D23]|uniref:PfkB family carbohydrate kinase n=1 Tax=unclassified Streptomyces TaxID=2593676 RepID=UPI001319E935|nr:PfkB family carbohydrate kinase [Streptomyces sp. ATexAB-D23]MYY02229.1 sugar kinase [Streptomyces sp. SID4913]
MTGGPDAVLVMGEALIDLVPGGDDPGTHRAQPGGAPANVAAGLARLGTPSWFAGALGGDGFARLIEERLVLAGTELGLCARSELPTALAVADPGPDGTGYHFHLQDTATFRLPERVSDVGRFGAVYAGGLAAVVPPAADAVAATARAGAEHSVLVVDPNVREDRTLDGSAAHRLRELCARAHVLKVSDEDVTALWPGTAPDETCARLAEENRLVVLTRGAAGSTAFTRDGGRTSVPAVRVDVVNTIGAGDAFMAAVLSWLADAGAFRDGGAARLPGGRAAEMLAFASQVAASVVAQSGTEPSRPRPGGRTPLSAPRPATGTAARGARPARTADCAPPAPPSPGAPDSGVR